MSIVFFIEFGLLLFGSVRVQTATIYVTEIITDHNGYWRSSTDVAPNAPTSLELPDNLQLLLAFTLNDQRFPTSLTTSCLQPKG